MFMTLDETFLSFLKEDNTNPTIPSPGNAVTGYSHEEQEYFIGAINSTLSALTEMPSLNPYYILERIKTRLKLTLGVTFDDSFFVGDTGSFTKRLLPHNIVNNAHTAANLPVVDNGWLNKFPHGLDIKIQFLKSGPLYHVNAEIVPCPYTAPPPPISED